MPERPFEEWFFLYLGIQSYKLDALYGEKIPLAEMTGELAGALANPEGYKEYRKSKDTEEARKAGKTQVSMNASGGDIMANTEYQDGQIVDIRTGEVVMSQEQLNKILDKI